ncbi:uncharacterized protein [Magallana gigas]|uniref:uncharacterized protein n=1 Tax=Magallana gigas TaxID=29159 RepID=UPI00333E3B00
MSNNTVTNNSRSEIHDWNYRMNRLNDQIAERRFRRDGGFYGAEGLSPPRADSGSRNLGYDDDDERKVNNGRSFGMPGDMEQRYQRNGERRNAGYRGQFGERSRLYQIPNDEDRTRSFNRNHGQEIDKKGNRGTDFRKKMRDDRHHYLEMDEMGYRETEFGKGRKNDTNNYQEIDETGYRDSEFRKERRNNRRYHQEMDDETGCKETEFCNGKAVNGIGRAYKNMGYMDRGLHHPRTPLNYPAPNAQYIDRGSDFPRSNMQNQSGSVALNTQAPLTVEYQLVGEPKGQEENEEKKPRKVWWYTTSRVFSAVLIIISLVSDWLQYLEMDDPIGEVQEKVKDTFMSKKCTKESTKDTASQFLYFTIAGTVLAALQLANIIYQIVQNHRTPIDTDIKDYIDERTEVFLVNMFVKFPQTFLIHRNEVNLCLGCGTGNSKQLKGFLNGFSSLASSIWRYVTHLKVSTCSCSDMCKRCTTRCGLRIKNCLLGCIRCLCRCPARYCCPEIKNAYPCCFMHLFCSNFWMFTNCCCQCKRDSKKSSLLAELASIPTSFVAFLYMLKVAKYFCMIHLSDLGTLVFDKIIAYFWDLVFHNK